MHSCHFVVVMATRLEVANSSYRCLQNYDNVHCILVCTCLHVHVIIHIIYMYMYMQ